MNRKQLNAAIAIVRKDATLRHGYVTEDQTKMCVIGGLCFHSRAPKEVKDLLEIHHELGIGNRLLQPVREYLEKRFGLWDDALRYLQQINDSEESTRHRREALIRKLKELADV